MGQEDGPACRDENNILKDVLPLERWREADSKGQFGEEEQRRESADHMQKEQRGDKPKPNVEKETESDNALKERKPPHGRTSVEPARGDAHDRLRGDHLCGTEVRKEL